MNLSEFNLYFADSKAMVLKTFTNTPNPYVVF